MEIPLLHLQLHEPDVALTDLALAIETGVFALTLPRAAGGQARLRALAALVFAFLCASSLLGALYHGFFPQRMGTTGGWVVWILTMLSIGGASAVFWVLSGALGRHPPRWLIPAVVFSFVGYMLFVVFVDYRFWVAIAFSVPALLVFLGISALRFLRERSSAAAFGVAAIVLMLVASALQQLRVGLHPVYFNHNALYHVIQGIALALLFACLRLLALAPGDTKPSNMGNKAVT